MTPSSIMCTNCRVSVTLAVLFAVGCGPTGAAATAAPSAGGAQVEIALGEEFVLRIGQTASLGDGTGLWLTFEAIREDSRCPVGVSCVWAGDAMVAIAANDTDTDGGTRTLELHTNPSFDAEAALDTHTVRLVRLSPVRKEGSTIEAGEYQATLVVIQRAK